LEFSRDLIGKCGIYCGVCRLFVLKKCEGCSNEEAKCPYYKCVENKAVILVVNAKNSHVRNIMVPGKNKK